MTTPLKIIIVEDEPLNLRALKNVLECIEEVPFAIVAECRSVSDVIKVVQTKEIDLALCDINLGTGTTFDAFKQCERLNFAVCYISGNASEAYQGLNFPVLRNYGFLDKPVSLEALQSVFISVWADRQKMSNTAR